MEIYSFKTLPSTQKYLLEKIKSGELEAPVAVLAFNQTAGLGSRENTWSGGEGNFFASFAISLQRLPEDLVLLSASIYFSFIMKKVLNDLGEKVWLKWPNDFYIDQDKVGGTITQKVNNILICGIGINLKNNQYGFRALKCDVSAEKLLKLYLEALDKFPQWKDIFSEYQVEFERSREFSVHIENFKKGLSGAILCEDGSLILEGKRVFSLR